MKLSKFYKLWEVGGRAAKQKKTNHCVVEEEVKLCEILQANESRERHYPVQGKKNGTVFIIVVDKFVLHGVRF